MDQEQGKTWHAGIGLGPGHTVLDGDPPTQLPAERGTAVPTLSKFTGAGFACVRIGLIRGYISETVQDRR